MEGRQLLAGLSADGALIKKLLLFQSLLLRLVWEGPAPPLSTPGTDQQSLHQTPADQQPPDPSDDKAAEGRGQGSSRGSVAVT